MAYSGIYDIDFILGGRLMIMTNFLKNRKSVRDFKNKKVDIKLLEEIKDYAGILEKEESNGGIKFHLYEQGVKLYEDLKGLGGYSGVMIESPHYLILETMNNQETNIIYSAYYMEKFISKINSLGLDTCWVSVGDIDKDAKDKIFGEKVGEIDYILAIGYSKPKNPFISESFSERIGIEDLVYSNEIGNPIDMEELENRGLSDLFYYVRFAPSARNKQPWRFLLEDDKLTLLLQNIEGEELDLMDAGIIMYYFESLASTIGINSGWKLIDKGSQDKDPKYKYIAEIKL